MDETSATRTLSEEARARMLSRRGEPLFVAAWSEVLMVHFEVDPSALQSAVPYPLDLRDGRAFVSLVMFTMRGMRPRWGGKLAAWLFRPIATHQFLNVRTYVLPGRESGIHFLAEWLSNPLAVRLGPATFGLPYRHGNIAYQHEAPHAMLQGTVTDARLRNRLVYTGKLDAPICFAPCPLGSEAEWLMERYTAFNSVGGRKRFFRVWHPPWPQQPATVTVQDRSLLTRNWPWFSEAEQLGANFSPGLETVWMGRPHAMP